MLNATIKTYHDTESELSFNSILNDGSPVQLTTPVSTTVWSDEVTVDATYGTWFAWGQNYFATQMLLVIKYNLDQIQLVLVGISGQTAKIELETKITESGQTTETGQDHFSNSAKCTNTDDFN